jgi:FlaA1/EpsC-like NDP-sugar epimerase
MPGHASRIVAGTKIAVAEDEVEIIYTGLRPGEKLFEELFYSTEEQVPTTVNKRGLEKASRCLR